MRRSGAPSRLSGNAAKIPRFLPPGGGAIPASSAGGRVGTENLAPKTNNILTKVI